MNSEYDPREFDESRFQDALYDVLSVADRRLVLGLLANTRDPTSVDELAAELAAAKPPASATAVLHARQTECITALVHVHLPKLREAGLIDWDAESGAVEPSVLMKQLSASTPLTDGLSSGRPGALKDQPST